MPRSTGSGIERGQRGAGSTLEPNISQQTKRFVVAVAPAANLTNPPEYLVAFVGSMPVIRSENFDFVDLKVSTMRETK